MTLTHQQRAERRRKIAEYVAAGHEASDAGRKFGVTIATVLKACRQHRVEATHPQRAQRRRKIVEYVAAGHTPSDAANRFGASLSMVYESCHEHGVAPTRKRGYGPLAFSSYRIIADLINTTLSMSELAARHALTRQRIYQIYRAALAAGIPVRRRSRRRAPQNKELEDASDLKAAVKARKGKGGVTLEEYHAKLRRKQR